MPRIWRRCSTSGLALLLLFTLAPLGAAEEPAEAIRKRARRVVADGGYQKIRPDMSGKTGGAKGGAPGLPMGGGGVRLPVGAIGTIGILMLYLFLAVAVGLLLAWIGMELARRRGRLVEAEARDSGRFEAPGAVPLDPGLAERLAAQQRYGEAVHALLLISIGRLCARGDLIPAESLTSRELADAFRLEAGSRDAFEQLVETVERCWFGGREAGPEDYQRCVERARVAVS